MEMPSPRYKWIVLAVLTLGVIMVSIDSTVVILAIPVIMADLHSSLVSMVWVLMSYIFVSTILLLALGRVADIYGRVRLYILGFIVFTLGSAFCGVSFNDWELIVGRVVQGAGGALMLVNAWPIITEVFPPNQRGTAMGINSMTFGIGGVAGPLLGGFILAITTWRWIFFINIPIGIAGTIFAYRYLRETSRRRTGEKLDLVGSVVFSISLFALLTALTFGVSSGWGSPFVLVLLGVFVVGLALFVYWERHTSCPALDLSLFCTRVFNFAILSATLQSLAIFAVQFLVVFYLQVVRGDTPLTAALLLLPMPIALAVTGPLGGRWSDRVGARIPATVGLVIQSAGVYWLSTLTKTSPYAHIALGLALTGVGGGLFYSPNTSSAMTAAPRDRLGIAAATLATLRNTGMVVSFALALAVAAGSIPRELMLKLFVGTSLHLGTSVMDAYVHGMSNALRVSVGICLLAAVMSLSRGREERSTRASREDADTQRRAA